MPVLQANDLLATHPACSEKRHHQPCRRPHERKLGDQTKDDVDKEPREERSCGRSQPRCIMAAVRIRAFTSPRCLSAWQPNLGRGSTYRCGKSVQTTGPSS